MLEKLAKLEHDQWANWMKHFFSTCPIEDSNDNDGIVILKISKEKYHQWLRQINTPYEALSESEKNSDREWAQKVLEIIDHHNT
jgi:hypothetical protein